MKNTTKLLLRYISKQLTKRKIKHKTEHNQIHIIGNISVSISPPQGESPDPKAYNFYDITIQTISITNTHITLEKSEISLSDPEILNKINQMLDENCPEEKARHLGILFNTQTINTNQQIIHPNFLPGN